MTLKVWYDNYAAHEELFDEDLRLNIVSAVTDYDTSYADFRANGSEDSSSLVFAAAKQLLILLPDTVNMQIDRITQRLRSLT